MYKEVGSWWNSQGVSLIEKEGEVYALNPYHWNGKGYSHCWKCIGEHCMNASEEKYTIKPVYDRDKFHSRL